MLALSNWRIEQGEAAPAGDQAEVLRWQDPATPLSISELRGPFAQIFRLRMTPELAVDVQIGGSIVVRPQAAVPQTTIDHFIADQVIPRLIAHQGAFVFHAAAVRFGLAALVFLGASGRGKSTLVTSFNQAGFSLLGDDAMILSTLNGVPHVTPVYPSLRLFPDSIEALMPNVATAGPVAHYSTKERIDVKLASDEGASALPIHNIFSIAAPNAEDSVSVRPLSVAEACMMLVESSFALDPTNLAQAEVRLRQATMLATAVPAFEISYPRDYDRLPDVRSAIIEQAQNRL
jgi:hypothetical protein